MCIVVLQQSVFLSSFFLRGWMDMREKRNRMRAHMVCVCVGVCVRGAHTQTVKTYVSETALGRRLLIAGSSCLPTEYVSPDAPIRLPTFSRHPCPCPFPPFPFPPYIHVRSTSDHSFPPFLGLENIFISPFPPASSSFKLFF